MALAPGTRLGVYEIVSALGAGGMGEVYRARDTRLDRHVALKILPEAFAADTDRVSRFQREARTLAALNHPHIAQIYGLEHAGDVHALAMELVPGDDLSQRIARGALPLDEALPIAKQIAEALEAAHEQAIIHRDLKPANIKVRPDGTVKVLDFGLAKALEPAAAQAAGISMSPTLATSATTQAGLILGTAAYMSPEQARGKTVDTRADIWAFGCVLYEMLTGTRAFSGDSVSDLVASILARDPDWTRLPMALSPALDTYLRRCLEKDPRQRVQAMGDVRLALDGAFETAAPQASMRSPVRQRAGRRRAAVLAGGALVVAAATGALVWTAMRAGVPVPGPAPQTQRYTLAVPENTTNVHSFAISPDGRHVVLAADVHGKRQLWLRPLAALEAGAMPGTEDATYPFWSPDSRHIGFFAQGKLKKIAASGGPAQTLCDVVDPRGGSWSRDDVIIFSPSGNAGAPIQRVSASGGAPIDVTERVEGHLSRFPVFLPDGRHFLYIDRGDEEAAIRMRSLDDKQSTRVLADNSSVAVAPGHLLFVRETTSMAQPFDMQRREPAGDAVPIAENVSRTTNVSYAPLTVSESGVLLYMRSPDPDQLTFADRSGRALGTSPMPIIGSGPALSPDEKAVVVERTRPGTSLIKLWLWDLTRGIEQPLTSPSVGIDLDPCWSPHGDRVAFASSRNGVFDLYQRPGTAAGRDGLLLATANPKHPSQWSRDGRFIVYSEIDAKTKQDLWVLPLDTVERKPIPFLHSTFNEYAGQLSPDSRWMAYTSDESGRREVYVRQFPIGDGQWRISIAGGDHARWRGDGRELYFIGNGQMMAVAVKASAGPRHSFDAARPQPLFTAPYSADGAPSYDVSADGKRFVVSGRPGGDASARPLNAVVNWDAGLKK